MVSVRDCFVGSSAQSHRYPLGFALDDPVGNVPDEPAHGLATPPTLIDAKTRAFVDESGVTDAERDFVDTVKMNWTSIRTYFR